jgi:hypothetical protein
LLFPYYSSPIPSAFFAERLSTKHSAGSRRRLGRWEAERLSSE